MRNIRWFKPTGERFLAELPSRIREANLIAGVNNIDDDLLFGKYLKANIGGVNFKKQAGFVTQLCLDPSVENGKQIAFQEDDIQKCLQACVNLRKLTCCGAMVTDDQDSLSCGIPETCFPHLPQSLRVLDLRGRYSECPDLRHLNQLQKLTLGRRGKPIKVSCSAVFPHSLRCLNLLLSGNMNVNGFSELPHLEVLGINLSEIHRNFDNLRSCLRLKTLVVYLSSVMIDIGSMTTQLHPIEMRVIGHPDNSHYAFFIHEEDDIPSLCDQLRNLYLCEQPKRKPEVDKQESKESKK
jgi:hypothetical protein